MVIRVVLTWLKIKNLEKITAAWLLTAPSRTAKQITVGGVGCGNDMDRSSLNDLNSRVTVSRLPSWEIMTRS